jgi:hypothetical protein
VIKAKIRSKASAEEVGEFGTAVRTLLWLRDHVTTEVHIDGRRYGLVLNRRPVSKEEIAPDLECAATTVYQHICKLRNLGAIITRHATWGLIIALVGSERWKGSKALDNQGRPRDCNDPATIRRICKTFRIPQGKDSVAPTDSGMSTAPRPWEEHQANQFPVAARVVAGYSSARKNPVHNSMTVSAPLRESGSPSFCHATVEVMPTHGEALVRESK